ncbi:MAG TPA: alanine--tRNA ligase-related protein [Ktedonobacterales bacterium]|nr:alanine--tRNA ligase-related protein [Ktedonobacterales bacterium]
MNNHTEDHRQHSVSSPEIARRYLAFFRARDHLQIAGTPLAGTESTLFVIAGMQPLLPWLRGEAPPPAPRLTTLQRCLRMDDADAVGVNGLKLSGFNMLGNWSIGDYGRREAIDFAMELLSEIGVDRSAMWVTVFGGDSVSHLPPDDETIQQWRRAGQPEQRIVRLGSDDNLWTMNSPGPCGPCTEMFIDRGEAFGCGQSTCRPGCSCERFLEFWNLVFIEYEWQRDGSFTPLPLRSVDTGMGLERIAAVLQETPTLFETDLYAGAQQRLAELAPGGGDSPQQQRARRVIVDAVRSALYIGLAGVVPRSDGRGSVMRRLIRRAARQGRILGLDQPFLGELVAPLVERAEDLFSPDEQRLAPQVAGLLTHEERRFARVLTTGLRLLDHVQPESGGFVSGEQLFLLHAERGFPADLAAEVLAERGIAVDWPGYLAAMERHHAISRVSVRHATDVTE